MQVLDILRRLAEEAGQRRMELKAAFREDGALDGAAALDVGPLLLLLRRLFPWISRREEWCLLGLLYKVDVNETGKISFGVST